MIPKAVFRGYHASRHARLSPARALQVNGSGMSDVIAIMTLTGSFLHEHVLEIDDFCGHDAMHCVAPSQACCADIRQWPRLRLSSSGFGRSTNTRSDTWGSPPPIPAMGWPDKLKILLVAAGARRDAKSQPGACANGFGRPDKFARRQLVFYTLAPTAADASAEPSRSMPPGGRCHSLRARRGNSASGDCELVEQFRNNVLPMFTTRNIADHITCVPHQLSGSNIDLRFESLAAVASAGMRRRLSRAGHRSRAPSRFS